VAGGSFKLWLLALFLSVALLGVLKSAEAGLVISHSSVSTQSKDWKTMDNSFVPLVV
jgi:hypothetical protein